MGFKKKDQEIYGHLKGIKTVKLLLNHHSLKKIPYLTLYTFSTENWKRPEMRLIFFLI